MTSASVALHESNLSLHADTFVLRWMCVHHGKVTRRRKPDEWWITCAGDKKVWQRQRAAASERGGRPWPRSRASRSGWQMPPSRRGPRSLAPLTWGGRPTAEEKSPAANGGHLLRPARRALCPCHMSLTLVFWLKHLETGPFSLGWDTKREEGEEKLTSPSLSAPAQILWKGRHRERNKIKSQQKESSPLKKKKKKAAVHPYRSPHQSPPYKTPWAPGRW